jgi:GNAT superfamily N-acetyltransferase
MTVFTKLNKPVIIRQLSASDLDGLIAYLYHLSPATVRRFQPHPYHKDDVINFHHNNDHEGWIAVDPVSESIIGYTVLKKGYLQHDYPRLQQYGVAIAYDHCYTIAPSVTDEWQSTGVGQLLFNDVLTEMKNRKVKQLILWGGVQSDNFKAVHFYQKNGFRSLGHFQYNGLNEDMILPL